MRILKKLLIINILLCTAWIIGQSQNPLDEYIQLGLKQNGLIKEQNELLEEKKTGELLAGKNWSPEINFIGNYTAAAGGRKIDFPIGDLLNPAYKALNEIKNTNQFPQFENQSIQFFPNNFYDVKARISQPIIRPEIKINQLLKKEQTALQENEKEIVARNLTLDIKKAYYQYIQSSQVLKILDQAMVLLNEGERVTNSLIKNGVAIPSKVLRIQSEKSKIAAQISNAQNQRKDAKEYFNFLIGRSTNDTILEMNVTELPSVTAFTNQIKNEEVKSIETGLAMHQLSIDLEKKYYSPKLGAQVDIGSQNFNFKYGGYILGGLQLDIPIWNNKKSVIKQQQIVQTMNALKEKKEYAIKGFELQLDQAKRGLQNAIDQYHSYAPILAMNTKYYTELMKLYKEGQTNQSELLDAQTQITSMELQQNIALYQTWIKAAEVERLMKK